MPRSALALAAALLAATPAAAQEPDFNRDVRPILAGKCFKCHGPDDKSRKADLRLDDRAAALEALRPGNADASEVVKRIHSADPTEVMPPPAVKNALTAREKDILKRWIAAGARYDPHWAFTPVRRPPVPPAPAGAVVRNPIDNFVLAALAVRGLTPSAEADRPTLARRVFLDLIGLPPTPEEVGAFVNDAAPDAYERMVDRLLASPQYGERWARRWLDLARYADTNGYEKDRARSIWLYRDYVVRAMNADVPFDRFTIEQLAGDLLPNPTQDQLIATGFHRNTMLNEEGGIDPLEFRYHAMTDRVAVTGMVWFGLTVGCAQCHTHKFDPISHTEYYRLFAFLNNADEPMLDVFTPEQEQQRDRLRAKIGGLEAALPDRVPVAVREKQFAAWLAAERPKARKWTVLRPTALDAGPHTKLTVQPDGSILATGDPQKRDVYAATLPALPAGVTAVRIEALPHDSLPARGPGRAFYEGPFGDFLLSEFVLTAGGQRVTFAGTSESFAAMAKGANPTTAAQAIDGQQQSGWAATGREGTASQAVFVPAAALPASAATLELAFERHYSASLGRFRLAVTTAPGGAKASTLPAEVEELLTLPDDRLTADQRRTLLAAWAKAAPELKAARDEIDAARKQLPKPTTTLVFRERPADFPRETHRHHRGEFLQPKEPVTPGGLAVLPPVPAAAPQNRLTLARWLVSPDNPLTARVTVNRQWQALFGRGIVRTVDDFGYQGDAPSHPALLDWLAAEFAGPGGWSMKKLHRLIVTSATYRQASRAAPEQRSKDTENVWLSRGPRVRLEAEQIRDSLLRASGLLSAKMGGPGVFPPQPAGVATEGSYNGQPWTPSPGEDRYRRGLYTFTKRTAPFAMSATFDGPSGEACQARREVSNTPLQALTMLNDQVLTEAAQALGRRALAHPGDASAKAAHLFRIALARTPQAEDLAVLVRFHAAQRERFAADAARATAAAGPGDGPAVERAAWAAVARAVFNLDEFVNKE
ncbi:PSD1 and planctomycete cytochrome C domain-containing protein [Urbifossiella limnaea]|uniref:Planctomycete cytochrome C n=1 Tax=Urbifossiella limnaea TaxID=2528023 RepID=A0A517XY50_9BACT|nr:PSD1 and planctomycete cytochrome C domain-containing protein [Urbifossiella limnaea]QDU22435.1 Planctomycete cytochrome C [Urbifossiella limnaea]